MSQTEKQYPRESKSGDYLITGENSNGVNITKDGNIFQYTGNINLEDLKNQKYNGFINPNDANNVGSFIGMFVNGGTDIKLGNNNKQSLNISNSTNFNNSQQNIIQPVPPSPVTSALPAKEPTPSPTPTPSVPILVVEEDEDVIIDDFDDIPETESPILFEIIQVKDNIQDNVPDNESLSAVNSGEANKVVKQNNNKVPKEGTDFKKYGSQFKIIQNDQTLGDSYYYPCSLFNQGDPSWGHLKGGGYSLKAAGCCYCSLAMLATHHKNNAGYTPLWFWDNAKKSTVVYWSVMAGAVGLTGIVKSTNSMSVVDGIISKKPLMFEWEAARANSTKYTKRHHWMVLNGKNSDGTYTIFDPNGGRIWRDQSASSIGSGLIRIFYFV